MNKLTYLLTSDFHFGHANMETLCHRPKFFESLIAKNLINKAFSLKEEGHDIILVNLGDTVWKKSDGQAVKELHNRLSMWITEFWLIRGNHDRLTNNQYLEMGFTTIYNHGVKINADANKYVPINFTHAPIYESHYRNIHGHLHQNLPETKEGGILISQELMDYRPITLEEVLLLGATPCWDRDKQMFRSAYEN
jgi:calcineurin-like phosphoesterase family protein